MGMPENHRITRPIRFGAYAIRPYPDGSKIRFSIKTTYPQHPIFRVPV